MALSLPTLDDILPGQFSRGYVPARKATPASAVTAAPEPSAYDTLTPDEKAQADKQAELTLQPRGALSEIGTGALRGLTFDLPQMVGQGLKSTGTPGDTLYDAGQSLRDATARNNTRFLEDANPDAHGTVVSALTHGAQMLAPSLAGTGAALALAPITGGASVALAGGLGAGLFGASQFQDTYEAAIKAGKTPEEARALGTQTGAIEGLGEGVAGAVGARFLGLGGKALRSVVPRVLGKEYTMDTALAGLRNPGFLTQFAKELGTTAAVETSTEMAQNYGEAAVEKNAGVSNTDPWDAATSAIGPTLALTAVLGPFGGVHLAHQLRTNQANLAVVEDPNANLRDKARASGDLAPMLEPLVGKDKVNEWRLDALMTQPQAKADAQQQAEAAGQAGLAQRADEAAAQQAQATALAARDQFEPSPGAPLALPAPTRTDSVNRVPVEMPAGVSGPELAPLPDKFQNLPASPLPTSAADLADRAAQVRDAARAAEEQRQRDIPVVRQQAAAVDATVNNPPEGALPFATWASQKRKADAKQRTLGLPATHTTAAGLRQGYVAYLSDFQRTQQDSITRSTEGQGELPLEESRLNQPVVRPETPAVPEAGPKNAMEVAMDRAVSTKNRTDAFAAAERQAAESKAKEIDKLAEQAKVQRNVEAANKLADDALAGRINGNTPVAVSDLTSAWQRAAAEHEINVGTLKGQALGRVRQAIGSAGGKKLWVQQITALRAARDAMTKDTVSRDSMSALITKLENSNGKSDAVSAEGQTTEGQQETGSGQKAPAVREDGTPQAAEVTPVNAVADDAAAEVPPLTTAATASVAAPKSPFVPAKEQRAVPEGKKFVFELYHYDDTKNPQQGTNLAWLNDVREAQALEAAPKQTQASVNAKRALSWLKDYEGADVLQRAGANLTRSDAMTKVNENLREQARLAEARIRDAFDQQLRRDAVENSRANAQRLGNIFGQDPKAAEQQATDEEDGLLQAAAPNLMQDPHIMAALGDVKRNVTSVLDAIARSGPTQWARDMAAFLRGLGLDTHIELVPTAERSKAKPNELRSAQSPAAQAAVERGKAALLKPVDQRTEQDKKSIRDMRRVQKILTGERVFGRYSPSANRVRIYLGGENAHTVLHEVTHAATVAKIAEARAATAKAFALRSPSEHAAAASLKELRALFTTLKSRDTAGRYAFTNEEEFVAELYSNEDFQQWLGGQQVDGRSLFARVMDWLRDLLGFQTIGLRSALDEAVRTSRGYFSDSRFGSNLGVSFNHSPGGAFEAVDRTVPGVLGNMETRLDHLMAQHKTLGNMPSAVRRAALYVASTFHIMEWIAKDAGLKPLVRGIQMFQAADGTKTEMLRGVQAMTHGVIKRIELVLSKYNGPQREAVNRKMGELSGQASMYGVDLAQDFNGNLASFNKTLNPALRSEVNRLHAEYMQLDPALRTAMADQIRVFRKGYIQNSAIVLRQVLRTHRAKYAGLVDPVIKALDIRDPALQSQLTPEESKYFADGYSKALQDRLYAAFDTLSGEGELGEDVKEIAKIYRASVSNPYSHLGRYGNHYLQFDIEQLPGSLEAIQKAMEPFGKAINQPAGASNHVFLRFENESERNAAYTAVKQASNAIVANSLRGGSLNRETDIASIAGVAPFVRNVLRSLDDILPGVDKEDIRIALKREMINYLPESSAAKALAPRRNGGVPGYEADYLRNYATRAAGMASSIANGYTMPLFDESFDAMRTVIDDISGRDPTTSGHAQDVYAEIAKRFSNSMSPVNSPVADRVKAFGYNFYLALSPAFWMVNLMQPWHLTMPVLGGRYGFRKSAQEMGKATAKALKIVKQTLEQGYQEGAAAGGLRGAVHGVLDMEVLLDGAGLTAGEKDFVQKLLAAGELDVTQGQQYGHLETDAPRWMSTSTKLMSIGSHYTEVVNRLTAGIAAYNLELSRGGSPEQAVARGVKTVRATQFSYSDRNTGRALGRHGAAGEVTPLLSSFQNYSFQSMELLFRMVRDATFRVTSGMDEATKAEVLADRAAAQKGLAGVMATTSILAGTLGLPFASVVARLADAMLGSGDDPSDIKSAYRQWLADILGKDVAEAVARGVPRAVLGLDTSNRAGLQDLLPGSRFLTDRRQLKDKLDDGALSLLGPAVSAGSAAALGISKMMDGQIMDGLVQGLPLALRGVAKAAQLGTQGYTTSQGNKLPLEVTPWAQAVQALGFTPSAKAEQSEANFAFRQRDQLLKQEKDAIANEFFRKTESGEDLSDVRARLIAFNQKNPQYRINPGSGLALRAKARNVAGQNAAGIATLPRYLPTLERYDFANTR